MGGIRPRHDVAEVGDPDSGKRLGHGTCENCLR
jgi:hypothetical protein